MQQCYDKNFQSMHPILYYVKEWKSHELIWPSPTICGLDVLPDSVCFSVRVIFVPDWERFFDAFGFHCSIGGGPTHFFWKSMLLNALDHGGRNTRSTSCFFHWCTGVIRPCVCTCSTPCLLRKLPPQRMELFGLEPCMTHHRKPSSLVKTVWPIETLENNLEQSFEDRKLVNPISTFFFAIFGGKVCCDDPHRITTCLFWNKLLQFPENLLLLATFFFHTRNGLLAFAKNWIIVLVFLGIYPPPPLGGYMLQELQIN